MRMGALAALAETGVSGPRFVSDPRLVPEAYWLGEFCEKEKRIMAWRAVPTTIPAISNALESLDGKRDDIVKLEGLPSGVGLISETTLFAYLDTRWRFKSRSCKRCGVGLRRTTSGTNRNR